MRRLIQFLRGEDAATAVEYAVMLGLIIIVCIVGIGLVGKQTYDLYNDSDTGLGAAFTHL